MVDLKTDGYNTNNTRMPLLGDTSLYNGESILNNVIMTPLKARRNITLAYIIAFCSELYFPIAIWIFFYTQFLTFQQIAIITAVQVVSAVIFELPTGAFADLYGRKKSIFLSYLLFGIAMFGVAFYPSFWMLVFIAVIKGLSNSLYSGSFEALVYDTLKETNQEKHFDTYISRLESLIWVALFISAVLGGFLYQFNQQIPWILQGIIYLGTAVITIFLTEPNLDTVVYHSKTFIAQNVQGIKELFKNRTLVQLTLLFITIGAGYAIAAEILGISQLQEYGMDSRGVGILFGIGYLISAAMSYLFPQLRKKFGNAYLLVTSAVILIASFLLAQYVSVAIGALLIISRISSSTTFRNVRSVVINKHVASQNRATALSAMALLSQLPYAILAYSIGGYIDATSPNAFAFLLGVGILALIAVQLAYFRKRPALT